MRTAFRLLRSTSSVGHAVGTICYRIRGYDYGCASEDSRNFGRQYVSMTLDPTGDYPYFTVPEADIEVVKHA